MSTRRVAWNFKDLTGQIFGKLTILRFAYRKNNRTYWVVKCSCNDKEIIVGATDLQSGNTKSCGCLKLIGYHVSHRKTGTRLYRIWVNIKTRCLNSHTVAYPDYGGRGIKMCDRWLESFENFYADEGQAYEDHVKEFGEKDTTADRFPDKNGNYEPSNFRWATLSEQARNKRDSSITVDYREHAWQRDLFAKFLRLHVINILNTPLFEKRFGISVEGFRKHIESQFKDGMSWDNYGYGKDKWQFDHIDGCNNFDLSKEEGRLKCNYYTNFQPLWGRDHDKKSRLLLLEV